MLQPSVMHPPSAWLLFFVQLSCGVFFSVFADVSHLNGSIESISEWEEQCENLVLDDASRTQIEKVEQDRHPFISDRCSLSRQFLEDVSNNISTRNESTIDGKDQCFARSSCCNRSIVVIQFHSFALHLCPLANDQRIQRNEQCPSFQLIWSNASTSLSPRSFSARLLLFHWTGRKRRWQRSGYLRRQRPNRADLFFQIIMPIHRSTLEDLSDEILMDIFDSLPLPVHIYYAFFNLNQRLNGILHDSRLLMSLDLSPLINPYQFSYHCEVMLPQMYEQLISLRLSNDQPFYEQIQIFLRDQRLNRFRALRQLSLIQITFDQLRRMFADIVSLNKLIRLDIDMFDASGVTPAELNIIANILFSKSKSIQVRTNSSFVRPFTPLRLVVALAIQSGMFHFGSRWSPTTRIHSRCLFCRRCATIIASLLRSAHLNLESRTTSTPSAAAQFDQSAVFTVSVPVVVVVADQIISYRLSFRYQWFNIRWYSNVSVVIAKPRSFPSRRSLLRSESRQRWSLATSDRETQQTAEEIRSGRSSNLVGEQCRWCSEPHSHQSSTGNPPILWQTTPLLGSILDRRSST